MKEVHVLALVVLLLTPNVCRSAPSTVRCRALKGRYAPATCLACPPGVCVALEFFVRIRWDSRGHVLLHPGTSDSDGGGDGSAGSGTHDGSPFFRLNTTSPFADTRSRANSTTSSTKDLDVTRYTQRGSSPKGSSRVSWVVSVQNVLTWSVMGYRC